MNHINQGVVQGGDPVIVEFGRNFVKEVYIKGEMKLLFLTFDKSIIFSNVDYSPLSFFISVA